jgi:hypothetical protein
VALLFVNSGNAPEKQCGPRLPDEDHSAWPIDCNHVPCGQHVGPAPSPCRPSDACPYSQVPVAYSSKPCIPTMAAGNAPLERAGFLIQHAIEGGWGAKRAMRL